jgi:predicted methyltransferase
MKGPIMRTPLRFALVFSATLLTGPGSIGAAHSAEPAASAYQAAIASPLRTDEDRKDDARRKPAEFLAFARVRPGMKVLDVASGGGATATLLKAAVGSSGEVWAQNPKANQELEARLEQAGAPKLNPVAAAFGNPVPQGTPPLDLITINMSYHDIANGPFDRDAMNKRLYEALRPGGLLVIVDNAAKKGSGLAATRTLHRIDEDTVVEEVTRAGFKVDARSDYLRVPSDPREQPFFKMDAPDDKFAIRFKK